jgi:hypothetical protein
MKWNEVPRRWLQVAYYVGIALFLFGSLDPLEGSVLIALASLILAGVTHLFNDPHSKYYRLAAWLILPGVSCLFLLSSMGGFGGESGLSAFWGLLLLPYPAGWLLILVLLFIRLFRDSNRKPGTGSGE